MPQRYSENGRSHRDDPDRVDQTNRPTADQVGGVQLLLVQKRIADAEEEKQQRRPKQAKNAEIASEPAQREDDQRHQAQTERIAEDPGLGFKDGADAPPALGACNVRLDVLGASHGGGWTRRGAQHKAL